MAYYDKYQKWQTNNRQGSLQAKQAAAVKRAEKVARPKATKAPKAPTRRRRASDPDSQILKMLLTSKWGWLILICGGLIMLIK